MDQLGSNFEDLGPEFDSVPFLAQAAEALALSPTNTGASARAYLEQARRALHPVVLDPDAQLELSAKRAERSERASRDPANDTRDTELAVTVGEGA